jgi:hypothetical protein
LSKSSRRSGRPGNRPVTRPVAGPGEPPAEAAAQPRSAGPSGSARAGRRDRVRVYDRPPLLERYRGALVAVVVVAVIGLIGAFVFLSATAPAYACTTEWVPDPTPSAAPGASARLGYVQPDQGRAHGADQGQAYTLCPPASGTHRNIQGQGPIRAGVYGPDDAAVPQGWIHNLEHGGLVLLYNTELAPESGGDDMQAAFREFNSTFPVSPICGIQPGNTGPVIARFDQMAWPYAALIWGRVLPLETWDKDLVLEFWRTEGERTNPERQPGCPFPTETPAASPSPSPTAS